MTDKPPKLLGVCCQRWWGAKKLAKVRIGMMRSLGLQTPRQLIQWYEVMPPAERNLYAMGRGDRCPCHDAPDPDRYRRFIAEAVRSGDLEATIDKFAQELAEAGKLDPNASP